MLLIPAFGHAALGQTCHCPTVQDLAHQGAPEKMFYLSNGKQIGLCGDVEKVDRDTVYSEVILYHCGDEGFFRGWDGIKTCTIHQDKDTIMVRHLVTLPIGKNMEFISTSFRIERYYYKGSKFVVRSDYRNDLTKFTSSQIQDVLDQYNKLTPGDDNALLLVARGLFWAYISGSAEAGGYLNSFDQKFGPFAESKREEFDEVHGLYWSWKMDHLMGQGGQRELAVP
ncbi:hypothetical protein EDB95_2497 [Dinghuibacter silviterrae]|uniref:Uncharacterized protein n=2 Tax=Dinghuibacter silviterrae TaxID=1539049 RepID=A0A4R8DW68_9BACT|nr:hypothetical protein EDB95_2497 [Dinghuibacter silviterrae]